MIRLLLTLAVTAGVVGLARAQDAQVSTIVQPPAQAQTHEPTDTPGTLEEPAGSAMPAKKKKAQRNAFRWHVSLRNVYDSNIDQNEDNTDSRGFIVEAGTRYTLGLPSGGLEVSYAIADHSFTNTQAWDRTTHNLEVSLEQRIGRLWTSETIGEMALKDASDDGDIRDEYRLVQRLEYRLTPDYRIRLDGALRFKKNTVGDEGKDARDPYIGMRLERRLSGGGEWRLGYRYDDNDAKDSMRSYRRSTWATSVSRDFGRRDNVSLEAGYERRRYTDRLVSTPGGVKMRRDRGWEIEAIWEHALRKDLGLAIDYLFENRRSNDSRREYDDHLVGATLTRTW